jgi:pre-rRNA-processing protein TSR4
MAGSGPAGAFGGLGSQIFGAAPVPPPETAEPDTHEEIESNGPGDSTAKDDDASDDELVIALAATTLDDSSWSDVPAYTPLYLSTCPEYVPPPPKAKLPKGIDPNDPDASSNDKGGGFAPEGYENSLETDHVFDRFSNRVAHEPEQCIRCVGPSALQSYADDLSGMSWMEHLCPLAPTPFSTVSSLHQNQMSL